MHKEIGIQYGRKVVILDSRQLKVECGISPDRTLPQSLLASVELAKHGVNLIFEDGSSVLGSIRQVVGDEETDVWVLLIRAGMVPSHPPQFAEKLQTCIAAQKKLEDAIAMAQDEYAKVVDPLTELKCSGNYEDYTEWREIPGFPAKSFTNVTQYDSEGDED